MASTVNNEKRTENRLPLTASIFYSPALDKYKDVKFWGITTNVSPSGIGIYAYQQLEEGIRLKVHSKDLLDNHRNARVMWCKEVSTDLYRSGLSFDEPMIDIIDISQKIGKYAECADKELKESKQMLEDIAQSITESIMLLSKDLKIRWANKAALRQTGLSIEELVGNYCFKAAHRSEQPCKSLGDPCPISDLIKTGKPTAQEHTHHDNNGKEIFVEVSCYPVNNESGELVGFVHFSKDITERKKMEDELQALSLTDELTGLHNRRGFFFLAEKLLKIAKRQKRRLLIFYADLDGLKEINDTWGHKAGDLALIEAADVLKSTYRESDIIARMGGDEFVILQMGTADSDSDMAVARLQEQIDARNAGRKDGQKLSISLGISYFDPENPNTIDALLSSADRSMYEKKKLRRKS